MQLRVGTACRSEFESARPLTISGCVKETGQSEGCVIQIPVQVGGYELGFCQLYFSSFLH